MAESTKESREQGRLPMGERPLLMLMDGHAMVHRAWHAIQNPLTIRRTGEEVKGVYGFCQMLLKAIEQLKPSYIAITFDRPTPTFRHRLFEAYKAQRPETAPELHQQFPYVHRLMEALHIPIFEHDEYEADDLLGTLSLQAEAQGLDTIILTGDTDTLQLVSPNVRVLLQYRIAEQVLFDESRVRQRYEGLTPAQLIHFKALRGDPSDNIPGVPGVGEKTALRLLQEFGTVQGIYENLDKLPEKQRGLLETYRDLAFQCLELVTIVRDVPVHFDPEASRFGQYDRKDVIKLLKELEFYSIVNRIPPGEVTLEGEKASASGEAVDLAYTTVVDDPGLEAMVQALTASSGFSFDTETAPIDLGSRQIDPMRAKLVGLSFAIAPGRAWYVPIGHKDGTQLVDGAVLERLKPVWEAAELPKVAHNANYDMTVLGNYGIAVSGLAFDTMVATHLLGRKALGLKNLALDVLGQEMTPISDLIGTGRNQTTMDQVPIEKAASYACADADMTYRLWSLLDDELRKEGCWKLFTEVEMPLVPVLVAMQRAGITLEVPLLEEMADSLGQRLQELEAAVFDSVGHQFNLNSPMQLGEVLFGELKLAEKAEMGRPKRTKTGGYSTDAAILESLREVHPVIDLVLEYRQLSKLKSTYVDALPVLVNPQTGRVHTSYNQAGSVTGRVSSNDPNLQNIPIRTELGRRIRVAFIAGEANWLLVAADYSQIELRVLAHLSQDPALLEAFQQDLDIHTATASEVFNISLAEVKADHRRLAKVLNFGIIYGLSAFGISQQTELSHEEGARFIESYFGKYPGVKTYIEETKQKARDLGYVETVLGRRRFVPEIRASNPAMRQAAEREAINMPVQGTAAEAMKLAMIQMQRRLQQEGFRARMLLQVHDELIFEAPREEVEPLKALLLEEMPKAMELAVSLDVAVKTGANWGELE